MFFEAWLCSHLQEAGVPRHKHTHSLSILYYFVAISHPVKVYLMLYSAWYQLMKANG